MNMHDDDPWNNVEPDERTYEEVEGDTRTAAEHDADEAPFRTTFTEVERPALDAMEV